MATESTSDAAERIAFSEQSTGKWPNISDSTGAPRAGRSAGRTAVCLCCMHHVAVRMTWPTIREHIVAPLGPEADLFIWAYKAAADAPDLRRLYGERAIISADNPDADMRNYSHLGLGKWYHEQSCWPANCPHTPHYTNNDGSGPRGTSGAPGRDAGRVCILGLLERARRQELTAHVLCWTRVRPRSSAARATRCCSSSTAGLAARGW